MAGSLSNREVAELYERYGHLVLRRCRAVLRDDAAADDAFQNTFVKLMRVGAGIRDADSPLRWLYRVADRCCFDTYGRRTRRAETELSPSLSASLTAAGAGPRHEAWDEVRRLLRTLNDRDRTIALLFFLDGMSQGEVAAAVGVSRQTVNKRVQRIRERAEKLRRRGRT